MPLGTHYGCTYLTHPYTVAPSATMQNEALWDIVDDIKGLDLKVATVEVSLAQRSAYLEFLADSEGALCTNHLEAYEVAALGALDGFEAEYVSKVNLEAV